MCGVSGIISKKNIVDQENILFMNEMINHRGPDQSGYLKYKNLLLGHVRLSVLDISDKGRQPMSVNGQHWIIFNGEVYNYKEIKEDLIKKNYKFHSKTDTEVVLNAFIEWGTECFSKFNGDWVIAIFDKKTEDMIIARDGIGCKPCYIYEDQESFVFSSEMKGLFGYKSNIDFEAENLGIHPNTLFSCSKTFFKNISQLPPGRLIRINIRNFDKKTERWNFPLENLPPIHSSYMVNQGEYFDLLYNATKLRLDADLKIGTSLSGGIDSSVIFTLLNLIQKNEKLLDHKKLDLNPIIMNYKECLTSKEAIEIAKINNRNYKIVDFENNNNEQIETIMKLVTKLEVIEEYSMHPLLYENQKKMGIHVSIDGHGADEFLGLPNFIPNLTVSLYNDILNIKEVAKKFGNQSTIDTINNMFGRIDDKGSPKSFKQHLDTNNYFAKYTSGNNFDYTSSLLLEDINALQEFDYSTQFTYMIGYCGFMQYFLSKWDRASMSSAVEVRSPFLDPKVIKYSLALPINKKIKNGITKAILRDSMEPYLPESILRQTFKQGLPQKKDNFENLKNNNALDEIINNKSFKESGLWDHNSILYDFNNKKNLNKIWQLSKHYLLKEGFKNHSYDVRQKKIKKCYEGNDLSLKT